MAEKKVAPKYKGELGGSGTSVYNGVIADAEYISILSTEYGGRGLEIFNRMRRSDPIVRASLLIVKLAILQADWYFEGDDQTQVDFCRDAFFERMDRSWGETLRDILTYLDFGFCVVEKVYKIEDNQVFFDKFAFRAQTSITKFETENGGKGVTQQLDGDAAKGKSGGKVSIPVEKLLLFSNEKEGDNWRGVSLLRSCYKPWFFKENFEKIDAIGFEREAVGVPVFTMPASPTADDSNKADELGQNLRANEKSYIKLPNGWEFDIKYPTGSRRDGAESIQRFNREIYSSFLAQFLDLGATSSGSRALSSDQSDALYRSLKAIADYVIMIINKYAVPDLIDFNFAGTKKYPKLAVTGIEKISIEMFTNALQRMVASGIILPDDELEEFVRMRLNLPKSSTPRASEDDQGDANTNAGDKKKDDKNKDKKPQKGGDNTPEKNDAAKGKRQARDRRGGRKFSFEPWRELTFAETKVNFNALQKAMDRIEGDIKQDITALMMPEVTNLLEQARVALQTKDVKRVQDLQIGFKEELRQAIGARLQDAYETGKITASNELAVKAAKNSTEVINYLTTQASVITDKMMSDILNEMKLNLLSMIQQTTPTDEALEGLEVILTDKIINQSGLTASAVVTGGINQGRNDVFDDNEETIYAIQRSELLDYRTCNYCISMDGRVFPLSDKFAKIGQYHYGCRGINVAIGISEQDKPEITGIPQDLRRRAGTLAEFQQMPEPKPLPGGLADKNAQ